MNLQEVYEKYHYLDHLLSDREWVEMKDEAGNFHILNCFIFDCWQAIKTELQIAKRPEPNFPAKEDLIKYAQWVQTLQPAAVEIMLREKMGFTDLTDPWQKLAFTFYSDLCEAHYKAEQLFGEEEE